MLHSLQQLSAVPAIFVLYYAGSSGEFLSHAISESFLQISPSKYHWENHTRLKFCDLYGRSFNSGDTGFLDQERLLLRANSYLESAPDPNLIHVGTAHPQPPVLNFISRYFPNHPVIEITTHRDISKKFRHLAIRKKITHITPTQLSWDKLPCRHGFKFNQHLHLEWEDIMLCSKQSAEKIQDFLNLNCDTEKFSSLIEQYKQHNKELLDTVYESNYS